MRVPMDEAGRRIMLGHSEQATANLVYQCWIVEVVKPKVAAFNECFVVTIARFFSFQCADSRYPRKARQATLRGMGIEKSFYGTAPIIEPFQREGAVAGPDPPQSMDGTVANGGIIFDQVQSYAVPQGRLRQVAPRYEGNRSD